MPQTLIAGDRRRRVVNAAMMKATIHPALLFVILSIQFSVARAIPLRGDWESSGDLPAVYRPVYPYAYDCQIEVTDYREYSVAGERRRIYAVANFRLDQDSEMVSGEDLIWTAALAGAEAPADLVIPFTLTGIRAGLAFRPGATATQDVVQLYVRVGLQVAGYEIQDDGRGEAGRLDTRLHARANISATPLHGGESPGRALYVECRKLR